MVLKLTDKSKNEPEIQSKNIQKNRLGITVSKGLTGKPKVPIEVEHGKVYRKLEDETMIGGTIRIAGPVGDYFLSVEVWAEIPPDKVNSFPKEASSAYNSLFSHLEKVIFEQLKIQEKNIILKK